MIRFIITEGHRYTLEAIQRDPRAPHIEVLSYDQLFRQSRLKRATYIFTDFDRLSAGDHELAARLYQCLKEAGLRVLNDPAQVRLRAALLFQLHRTGFNGFKACRAEDGPSDLRYPVFVRKMRGHGWPSALLNSPAEVEECLRQQVEAGVPRENLLVIEYVGEPIRPGLFRKLAAFRYGSVILPYVCGHDDHWLVKVGKTGIAGEELYEDEYRIVRDNPWGEELMKAFEIAQIEYGRADYGFYQGRLQVFRINTNPHLPEIKPNPSPRRMETGELFFTRAFAALHDLDSHESGWIERRKDALLDAHGGWKGFFYRTRPVS